MRSCEPNHGSHSYVLCACLRLCEAGSREERLIDTVSDRHGRYSFIHKDWLPETKMCPAHARECDDYEYDADDDDHGDDGDGDDGDPW